VEKKIAMPFTEVLSDCRSGRLIGRLFFLRLLYYSRKGQMDLKQALHEPLPSLSSFISDFIVFCHYQFFFLPFVHVSSYTCSSKEKPNIKHVRRVSQSSMLNVRKTVSICEIEDSALALERGWVTG
jgi:hypothetical protein